MLAAVYNDRKIALTKKEKPVASKDGAVMKVLAASICGTDFRTYLHGSSKITNGTTIGHEVYGALIEIGEDVAGFHMGDRVTVTPALGCGECYMCRKGHTNMCDDLQTIGFEYDGAFAEYMEIPGVFFRRDHVNLVPGNVNAEQAVLAEPVACAINAQGFLNIRPGDYVAIFGAGFIGSSHAELAKAQGAEKIILIEPNEDRLRVTKQFIPEIYGVTGDEDIIAKVAEITEGRGADVVIVACSVGSAQAAAQQIIAKRGRISLFGGLPGESAGFIDSNVIHYKEVGVFGVHASTGPQNRKAIEWLADGTLDTSKYVTNRYPLNDIMQAFEDIKTRGIMKAIIFPNED
ncbi:MAG: alcohol dehydrogenase catalytic domain-containing protein [Clostridiales Family XIII bacterium]|jgi:L-iditol 2-dehydrogenase|nr:alcohol dehydrogenase catalytic domain-containing protein [Clostridiales Family XIII bacterium]